MAKYVHLPLRNAVSKFKTGERAYVYICTVVEMKAIKQQRQCLSAGPGAGISVCLLTTFQFQFQLICFKFQFYIPAIRQLPTKR